MTTKLKSAHKWAIANGFKIVDNVLVDSQDQPLDAWEIFEFAEDYAADGQIRKLH